MRSMFQIQIITVQRCNASSSNTNLETHAAGLFGGFFDTLLKTQQNFTAAVNEVGTLHFLSLTHDKTVSLPTF